MILVNFQQGENASVKAAAKIASFYWHGFRSMQTGRTLWLIIIIKLIIIFGFLKLVLYPDLLHSRFDTDAQRAAYVLDNITQSHENNNKKDGL
jgi:hypothetical protein